MRLIDADALPKYTGYALSADEVAMAVANAPTIKAEPVKHGRWEVNTETGRYRCSSCKVDETVTPWGKPPFIRCPNCGAKMDGGENE